MKLSFIVKPSGQPRRRVRCSGNCHRFGICKQFVHQVFQWLHLHHSGQRAPIQFYIDVNFEEFQFGVLANKLAWLLRIVWMTSCLLTETTIFSRWLVWRALAACWVWVFQTQKVPFPSQVHCVLRQHLMCHRHRVANTRRLEFGHSSCNGRHIVWKLRVQLHSSVWWFGRAKLRLFSCRQHEHHLFG